jgi:hypothetical protein
MRAEDLIPGQGKFNSAYVQGRLAVAFQDQGNHESCNRSASIDILDPQLSGNNWLLSLNEWIHFKAPIRDTGPGNRKRSNTLMLELKEWTAIRFLQERCLYFGFKQWVSATRFMIPGDAVDALDKMNEAGFSRYLTQIGVGTQAMVTIKHMCHDGEGWVELMEAQINFSGISTLHFLKDVVKIDSETRRLRMIKDLSTTRE